MSKRQQLALTYRPRTLDDLVGQDKLVNAIRSRPNRTAWGFKGGTGSGKTTIARILGVSYQCKHQELFGNPCDVCYRRREDFDYSEINASETTRVEDVKEVLRSAHSSPSPGSRKRVFVLDESHRLSPASQNLLLKYFEDSPPSTVWIICTTEIEKILATLRRRCIIEPVLALEMESVRTLVRRVLKFAKSDLASGDLIDQLWENGVTSAGLVMNAVDKYVGGASAEDAAKVEGSSDFDVYTLCRAIMKADMAQAMKQLASATSTDCREIKIGVAGYLKGILLNETEPTVRTKLVADCITQDFNYGAYEDSMWLPLTVAAVAKACARFAKQGGF